MHDIDHPARTVTYRDPDGRDQRLDYDHLLITGGSVNKLLPIPGVGEHAHGFRNLAEAVYLRDHLVRQIELADGTDDEDERTARLTFVVVGAGYTGTEVAAQGVLATRATLRKHPRLRGRTARWLLLDTADRVLPGLRERLSQTAAADARRARRRGPDRHLGQGGHRRRRAAHRRQHGADPVADLVRRGAARPAGGDASGCPPTRAG